jgi:hypothetical protein
VAGYETLIVRENDEEMDKLEANSHEIILRSSDIGTEKVLNTTSTCVHRWSCGILERYTVNISPRWVPGPEKIRMLICHTT